jgi:putative ABC transport system ATP-binding protein
VTAAISLADLRFSWPGADFALHVPRWDVPVGQLAVVHGPSGCGKSTLLGLLGGALVGRGSILVDGQELGTLSDRARREWRIRRVGLVFQDFPLVEHLTVEENVLLPFRLDPRLRVDGSARDRAQALLSRLDLAGLESRRPRSLSQGERQRVAFARALVTEPALILADEPTAGLDPRRRDQAMDLLEQIRMEQGPTVVVVTHDPAVVARAACTLDLA